MKGSSAETMNEYMEENYDDIVQFVKKYRQYDDFHKGSPGVGSGKTQRVLLIEKDGIGDLAQFRSNHARVLKKRIDRTLSEDHSWRWTLSLERYCNTYVRFGAVLGNYQTKCAYCNVEREDSEPNTGNVHLCTVFHSTRNPIILKRLAWKL